MLWKIKQEENESVNVAGIEKLWEKLEESYQSMRGKPPPQEVDPASLVGTFSRYKN